MNLRLNREQLKIIAICSMVIDHLAWGFVDFYSVPGQILHVMGRLTIPIMCFFVAEGFRKTSNLRKYIDRMLTFGLVSVIPFYVFFHEEYGYRTNIIFDLLFGLLALTLLESKCRKWQKVLGMTGIFTVSMLAGGWPVLPTCFILIFYYGRSFQEKAAWFIAADVATVLFLVAAISLNSIYHFSHYEWVWWDKFYQLGFILALPLLYCYSGEKGKTFGGRYFFYLFYPVHFGVLTAIKYVFVEAVSAYTIYLAIHVLVLVLCGVLILLTMQCRSSREQTAIVFFLTSGTVYVFGFILEIISRSAEMYHLAVLTEYFGEVMTFVGLVYFIKLLCKIEIPFAAYIFQIVVGILILYMLFTTRENGFFYREIAVNTQGAFPRLELTYGVGFYITITFIALLSFLAMAACVYAYRRGNLMERKRMQLTIIGVCLIWLPYPLKLLGLTGGYEIPGIGIALAGICFYFILIRYGFLDSVSLASESALDHGQEGIVVLGVDYRIQYHNKQLDEIFGEISHDIDLRSHKEFGPILEGKIDRMERNGRIYELRLEQLRENGYDRGMMIWILDNTEHYEALEQMVEIATKDSLTKLYNRAKYQELVENHLQSGGEGVFMMMDLDNFKGVNDRYGHQTGDGVLQAVAQVLKAFGEAELIGCRIGGDEFSAFLKDKSSQADAERTAERILKDFQEKLVECGYEHYTSISLGALRCGGSGAKKMGFTALYNKADAVLYEVKQGGKNTYKIRQTEEEQN